MSLSQEADRYIEQAEKKLSSFSLFNSSSKWRDGLELYERGISSYKLDSNWIEAAKALKETTAIHMKLGRQAQAAKAYAEAAAYFAKEGDEYIKEAQECLNKAIDMFIDQGKFSNAAALEEEIAQIFEDEGSVNAAIQHFQKAADYYEADNKNNIMPRCLLKVAELNAISENYLEAAKIFENLAKLYLKDKMLKVKARPLYLQASICHLAQMTRSQTESSAPLIDGELDREDILQGLAFDTEGFRDTFDKYKEADYTLESSHEGKLIEGMISSIEKKNIKIFESALQRYDQQVKKLDDWYTTMLMRVKSDAVKSWTTVSLV